MDFAVLLPFVVLMYISLSECIWRVKLIKKVHATPVPRRPEVATLWLNTALLVSSLNALRLIRLLPSTRSHARQEVHHRQSRWHKFR